MTTSESPQEFWPAGALSLSFDDGCSSQTAKGLPLLDALGLKATFYVQVKNVYQKPELWQKALFRRARDRRERRPDNPDMGTGAALPLCQRPGQRHLGGYRGGRGEVRA